MTLMHTSVKLGLAALAASVLLASAVGTASARGLSMNSENIRVTWARLEFQGGFFTVSCPVTMEGSYHGRTISKAVANLKGGMRRMSIKNESCTNGTVAVERLPWHWVWDSFTGTLPNITATRLLRTRMRFSITSMGTRCEFGNESDRVVETSTLNASREVTSYAPVAGRNIVTGLSAFPCPTTVSIVGPEGTETVDGTTTRIRMTLI